VQLRTCWLTAPFAYTLPITASVLLAAIEMGDCRSQAKVRDFSTLTGRELVR